MKSNPHLSRARSLWPRAREKETLFVACSMAAMQWEVAPPGGWLTISPPWPGQPYPVFCPDDEKTCRRLTDIPLVGQDIDCFEPEQDTFEVLSSLLLHCDNCTYVDIGCNIGLFAAYAARLGASVKCFEPQAMWKHSLPRTASAYPRFEYEQAAIVPGSSSDIGTGLLTFQSSDGYRPCEIGVPAKSRNFTVPTKSIDSILLGQRVSLLKIDIDSIDGALLHTATDMLGNGTTVIESILVELGCMRFRTMQDPHAPQGGCSFAAKGRSFHQHRPRAGDIYDLWRLQTMGYQVYRIRVHTNQEIFDWRGADVNEHKSTPNENYVPLRHVRTMKKLEWLPKPPTYSADNYSRLIDRYQSLLITRVPLAEVTLANVIDLNLAPVIGGNKALNRGNPALRGAAPKHGSG